VAQPLDIRFQTAPVHSLPVVPRAVVSADFDEDGNPDLAVIGGTDVLVVFGNDDGSFEAPLCLFSGQLPWLIEAADLDLDTHVDLIVADRDENTLVVLLSDGLGGFVAQDPVATPVAHNALNLTVGDLDHDGIPDVVSIGGNEVVLLRGDGTAGIGDLRTVRLRPQDPFTLQMLSPPSAQGGEARFVLYLWLGELHVDLVRQLPFGLGPTCRPMVLSSPPPALDPVVIWNNIPGHARLLGLVTRPSMAAPTIVERLDAGLGIEVELVLQGIIVDSASPQGQAAVTNAVRVVSEG
jgi:hypothetical protein